jgi:hypothetical protein
MKLTSMWYFWMFLYNDGNSLLQDKETFIFYDFIIIHRSGVYYALILMYLAEWIDKKYI